MTKKKELEKTPGTDQSVAAGTYKKGADGKLSPVGKSQQPPLTKSERKRLEQKAADSKPAEESAEKPAAKPAGKANSGKSNASKGAKE